MDAHTAASQLRDIVSGPLDGLSAVDAGLLRLAGRATTIAPFPVVALMGARLRYETRELIFPAERSRLGRRLAGLRARRRRPNLNLLGEAVLGVEEATKRASAVEALLRRDDVDCVSVKVSAVAAGLSLVDFDGSVARVCGPLHRLYRAAAACQPPKLVNLDMEEHRDLDLTVESFVQALAGRPGRAQRRDRPAGLPPRQPRRPVAPTRLRRRASPGGQRPRAGTAGEGGQPGDGEYGRRAGGLAASAVRHQGGDRRLV